LLAKTYFDLGEFQRCAFVLSPSDSFFPVASNGGGVPSPRPNTGPTTGAGLRGLAGEELFLKGCVWAARSLTVVAVQRSIPSQPSS
jgi:hypothetical protein